MTLTRTFPHILLVSCLLVVCFVLSGVQEVYAQGGMAVRVQPSTIEGTADPGTSIGGVLNVSNREGGLQRFYIKKQNIVGMDDVGRPSFAKEPPDDPMRAAAWIHPEIDTVDLGEGESIDIPYRIDVPPEASPGSYFAAIFVTREADSVEESGAGVGYQVAALVNLRVAGDAYENILFRALSTDRTFYSSPSVEFTARLENAGTVYERPHGIIVIANMFGKKTDQITINAAAGGIMPNNDRVYNALWDTDNFSLGRYEATASVVYGETARQTVTRSITFWVVPVKEVGLVLGILVFLALLITWGMRSYVRRALARAGVSSVRGPQPKRQMSFVQRLVKTFVWLCIILALVFVGLLVFFS